MQALLNKIISAASVTPRCPRCKGVIPSEDVNVARDIAFCRACNLSYELSALTAGIELDPDLDVNQPPAGAWFVQDGTSTVTGATNRSLGQAMGLLFFCLFWNGIVSVFVAVAFSSTLHHLGVGLPHWFPAPVSKGNIVPLPMTIFLWLFLTPFIAVGLAVLGAFLSSLGGRTEVRIEGDQATLFTGIGSVGFRKRFSVSDVKAVRLEDNSWRDSNGNSRRQRQIVIERQSGKTLKFASMLTEERRKFVAGAVRKVVGL